MSMRGVHGTAAIRSVRPDKPPFADMLELWLDPTAPATSIVAGAVATLGDRSGNGRHLTQATGTKRPVYIESDVDFGGRPSMTFDGVDDFLNITTLPSWPQHTVCVVYHGGAAVDRRFFAYGGGTGGETLLQNNSATVVHAEYFNTAATRKLPAIVAGATRRMIATFDTSIGAAAVPEVYLDGADTAAAYNTTTASNGPLSGTQTLAVGANRTGTNLFFDDKIAEVLVFSGALTDAQIIEVDEWLRARYATIYPPYVSDLDLWLDLTSPDTVVSSGVVVTVGDRSGNGRHFTQATSTKRPVYTASDVDFGGRPSMTFDGTDDELVSAAFAAAPNSNVTIVTVHKATAGSGLRGLLSQAVGQGVGRLGIIQNTGATLRSYLSNPGNTYTIKSQTTTPGVVYRSVSVYNTATGATAIPAQYLDGVVGGSYISSVAGNTATPESSAWALGSVVGSLYYDGKITEAFIFNRTLSAHEVSRLDRWLELRYATTYPPFASDLELWLDLTSPDTSIVTGAVAIIGDRSGNGRHATQAIGTQRPLYTSTDADFGGRPTMTGDGVDDMLSTVSWAPVGNLVTWYFVAAGSAAVSSSNERLFERGRTLARYASTTQLRVEFTSTGTTTRSAPVTLQTPHVIGMVYDATTAATAMQAIYIDGTEVSTSVSALATVAGLTNAALYVLNNAASNRPGTSTVGEIIAFEGAHTAAQAAIVSAWLAARYNL